MSKLIRLFLLLAVCALSLPLQVSAASTAEFSPSLRTAYDRVVSGASGSVAAELRAQDERLQALRNQEREVDASVLELHRGNDDLLLSIQARSKELDKDKLTALEKDVADSKDRYKLVYSFQGSLSKQLSAAKKLKNKTLASSLQLQWETVKAAAELTRAQARAKEELLSKAKTDKSKKLKELRSKLAEADKLKVRIQTSKSDGVKTGKQITAGLKSLASTAKKGDAGQTLASVSSLAAYSSKLLDQKRSVAGLEEQRRDSLQRILEWLGE